MRKQRLSVAFNDDDAITRSVRAYILLGVADGVGIHLERRDSRCTEQRCPDGEHRAPGTEVGDPVATPNDVRQ
jgi:hypothetical protein